MISSHENGLANAHADDLAPLDLLLATDDESASAPGTDESTTSGVIDLHHARPHSVNGDGALHDLAGDIRCAHPLPNSPPEHLILHGDRGG